MPFGAKMKHIMPSLVILLVACQSEESKTQDEGFTSIETIEIESDGVVQTQSVLTCTVEALIKMDYPLKSQSNG